MRPDPLAGRSAYFVFDHVGDLLNIPLQDCFVIGRPRLELEYGANPHPMSPAIGITTGKAHQDGHPPECRQSEWSVSGTGRAPEKRNENTVIGAGILVEQHDHDAAILERSGDPHAGPTHRNLIDAGRVPKTLQGPVEHRLVDRPIDDRDR